MKKLILISASLYAVLSLSACSKDAAGKIPGVGAKKETENAAGDGNSMSLPGSKLQWSAKGDKSDKYWDFN